MLSIDNKKLAQFFADALFKQIKERIDINGNIEGEITMLFLELCSEMTKKYMKKNDSNHKKKSRKSPKEK